MSRIVSSVASILAAIAIPAFTPELAMSQSGKIVVGDACPDFEMKGSDGKTYKLADFKGKKGFVIAWFPKAFTGG
ncbi:MAG: redoxin domain-containing protein [Planctomycetota bacterium]